MGQQHPWEDGDGQGMLLELLPRICGTSPAKEKGGVSPSPVDNSSYLLLAGTILRGWEGFKSTWEKPFPLRNAAPHECCGSVVIPV